MIALLSILMTGRAAAQDVLKDIVNNSLEIINDTTKDLEVRKVAVFKYDALTYIQGKLLPAGALVSKNVDLEKLNTNIRFLNEQALAMNQLISLYQRRMEETKKKHRAQVTELFNQATFDHKLFNDEDTELTLAYYQREDYPIQFCLDCDWVKTLAFIRAIDWSKL